MGDGPGRVALAFGQISQVLLDRGIVRVVLLGGGEVVRGLLQAAEPEVDPSERVEVRAIARFARHRFLQQIPRLFEPGPLVRPHVAEVVLRGRIVRPSLEELLEDLLRLGGRPGPLERGPQSKESFAALREPDGRVASHPT